MATNREGQLSPGEHPTSRRTPPAQEPPSANHFIRIHESHIPWEGDTPIVHEDEHYETLAEEDEEEIPKIAEHFQIVHDGELFDTEHDG